MFTFSFFPSCPILLGFIFFKSILLFFPNNLAFDLVDILYLFSTSLNSPFIFFLLLFPFFGFSYWTISSLKTNVYVLVVTFRCYLQPSIVSGT